MHAVIKTGGKQYRVKEGDVLKIEQLPYDIGHIIDFTEILMITKDDKTTIGTPFIAKASVKGEVLSQGRHKKVRIIKFRRRKHHMKRMGHRQNFTEIKITAIGG